MDEGSGSRPRDEAQPSERAQGVVMVEALLRLLRHIRDHFPDDDLATVTVFLTVVAASTGHTLRDRKLLSGLGGDAIPTEVMRLTSGRAIAAATGLPRETVRRKLRDLVVVGRILEVEDGFRIPRDTLNRDRNLEFVQKVVADLEAAPDRLAAIVSQYGVQAEDVARPERSPRVWRADELTASDRAKAVVAAEALLRMLRCVRDCFPDDDLETVTVVLTITAASSSHAVRDRDLLATMGAGPLPDEQKRMTSGRAIAAATGLPRETVRRKVRLLIDQGRAVETEGGVRTRSDVINQARNLEFVRCMSLEFEAAARRLAFCSTFDSE